MYPGLRTILQQKISKTQPCLYFLCLFITVSVQGKRSFPATLRIGEPNLLVVDTSKCSTCVAVQLCGKKLITTFSYLKNCNRRCAEDSFGFVCGGCGSAHAHLWGSIGLQWTYHWRGGDTTLEKSSGRSWRLSHFLPSPCRETELFDMWQSIESFVWTFSGKEGLAKINMYLLKYYNSYIVCLMSLINKDRTASAPAGCWSASI